MDGFQGKSPKGGGPFLRGVPKPFFEPSPMLRVRKMFDAGPRSWHEGGPPADRLSRALVAGVFSRSREGSPTKIDYLVPLF